MFLFIRSAEESRDTPSGPHDASKRKNSGSRVDEGSVNSTTLHDSDPEDQTSEDGAEDKAEKHRRRLESAREARLQALGLEEPEVGQDAWGGSDEEPPDEVQELMDRKPEPDAEASLSQPMTRIGLGALKACLTPPALLMPFHAGLPGSCVA